MDEDNEKKVMTLGFYNGIIYPLAFPKSINIAEFANSAIKGLLGQGMNLSSIIKKAKDNLEKNEIMVQESGIKSGLIIPIEMFLMKTLMGIDYFLTESNFNVWLFNDENVVTEILEGLKDIINEKKFNKGSEKYALIYGFIAIDLFISIAVLLKLKQIKDDKKNGFITYDYDFCIQQMQEISNMKRVHDPY
jgi:hypothetical protein